MADIKQFVTPDNLGPDFEQDATAKEIKVNIDGVTLIRNAEGKLEAVGGGDSAVYNVSLLPDGAVAPNAPGDNALAAGQGAVASGASSTVIGNAAISTAPSGVAIGNAAKSSAPSSVAIGHAAEAVTSSSVAIGNAAEAKFNSALAIGNAAKSLAVSSVAIGHAAEASKFYSTALGHEAKTSKLRQVSIATLDGTTHLAATPRLLSGVAKPVVGQDAANKDYVDNYIKAKVEALPEGATLEDLITALKS